MPIAHALHATVRILIHCVVVLGIAVDALAGWRFLVSPSYRASLRVRWRSMTPSMVKLEMAGLFACFSLSLLGLAIAAFFISLIVHAHSG
ncbi:MAG: hypothetical protein ACJ8GW_19455 [Massilia sp.]